MTIPEIKKILDGLAPGEQVEIGRYVLELQRHRIAQSGLLEDAKKIRELVLMDLEKQLDMVTKGIDKRT